MKEKQFNQPNDTEKKLENMRQILLCDKEKCKEIAKKLVLYIEQKK